MRPEMAFLIGRYPPRRIAAVILIGGVVAGTLDIFVAAAINHAAPGTMLQAIASGLLGKASFLGGRRTMLVGLILQWLMSLIIAAIYIMAAVRLPILFRRPALMGALHGLGVFLVMSFVVVPLSAAWPKGRPHSAEWIGLNVATMILFGLIIAFTPRMMRLWRAEPAPA
jgi:hypothetical protein